MERTTLPFVVLVLLLIPACTGDPVDAAKKSNIVQDTRTMRVQLEMKGIAEELDRYRAVHGDWPEDLADLRRPIRDPWGNEYVFEIDGDRAWIMSAGPDGEFDTDDDIGGGK